jgi:hypothetical protein
MPSARGQRNLDALALRTLGLAVASGWLAGQDGWNPAAVAAAALLLPPAAAGAARLWRRLKE